MTGRDDAGSTPCVSLTTDYGLSDGFVAACHGVLARLAPAVRVIEVTHLVTRRRPPGRGGARTDSAVPAEGCARRGGRPGCRHHPARDRARRARRAPGGAGQRGRSIPAAEALGGVSAAVGLTNPEWMRPGRLPHLPRPGRLRAGRRPAGPGRRPRRGRPGGGSGTGWSGCRTRRSVPRPGCLDRRGADRRPLRQRPARRTAAALDRLDPAALSPRRTRAGGPAPGAPGGAGRTFADAAPGRLVVLHRLGRPGRHCDQRRPGREPCSTSPPAT